MSNNDEFRRRVEIERVLLALVVHGQSAVLDHLQTIVRFYRDDWRALLEVEVAAREVGIDKDMLLDLVCDEHPPYCACWACIAEIQTDVVMTRAQSYLDVQQPAR